MNLHNSESFLRQPHQFGSLPSPSKSDANSSQKNLIILGNVGNNKEKINTLLNTLGVTNYRYLNDENKYKIYLAPNQNSKDVCKSISDYLKINNLTDIKVQLNESKDERNVYVKNLPLNFTESQLNDLFQPFGSIISKKVIPKVNNNNSIGFVRYTSKEEAERAIKEINMKNIVYLNSERSVRCEFSKTSNPIVNLDNQRLHGNYHSTNLVPRFRNFKYNDSSNIIPNYPQQSFVYNSGFDINQFNNQFSNLSVSPISNNPYYPNYGPFNVTPCFPYNTNVPVYPYFFYQPNNQNYPS